MDRPKRACNGCSKAAPTTETSYTLISARFGWRVTRSTGAHGAVQTEWWCRECWVKRKAFLWPDADRSHLRTPGADAMAAAKFAAASLRGGASQ